MPAKVEKIKSVDPAKIGTISLDTSFLICFFAHFDASLVSLAPCKPAESFACFEYLLKQNILCCVSDFVVEEVYFKILQKIGRDNCRAARLEVKYWKDHCEKTPSLIQPAYPIINKFNQLLDDNFIAILDYDFVGPQDKWLCRQANDLMQKFNITSNDAFIIVHSLKLSFNSFLCFDNKWKDIDNIILYKWK